MNTPQELAKQSEVESIADLEDEVAALQRRNLVLEHELKSLRRSLRRTRRNFGFEIANGLQRALRPVSRLLGDKFPRPGRNHSATFPPSPELCRLVDTLGNSIQTAFFTSPTERNWKLHKTLLRTRCAQLCLRPEQVDSSFFAVPDEPLETFKGSPALAHQELIVIDCTDPGPLWPLLNGRFWPQQKILLHGKIPMPAYSPTETGPDFAFYAAPPLQWLDPRHRFAPPYAPWKSLQHRLSAKLPSANPWPKISVVTPSFNQGKFITETFESVLGQKYPNVEYLVLDGGSTDDTPAIINRYSPKLAYACSQKDNGQADAINKGFARATGDILAWLNSDDQYPADALMHVAIAFDTFPDADIVVGGCGLLEADQPIPSRIHHSRLPIGEVVSLPLPRLLDLDNCWLKGHFFYQPEVFWRRRIWEAAGGHVLDDLYYCFDYDLWVRMAQAGAKIVHIPDLLALYRVHPAQKTYGENLPYLPELKLVRSRRQPSASSAHEPVTTT